MCLNNMLFGTKDLLLLVGVSPHNYFFFYIEGMTGV